MNNIFLKTLLCGCCFLPVLSGCTPKTVPTPVQPGAVETVLSRNARLISEEMVLLMGASAPESVQAPALAPMPRYAAIDRPLQIVWHGGLFEGVQLVASKIDFKAEVYGATPATPVVVDSMNRATAQDILQQFGVQSGERANIIVDIPARTIRVVYASFVGKPEPKAEVQEKSKKQPAVKTSTKKQKSQTKKHTSTTKRVLPAEKQPVAAPPPSAPSSDKGKTPSSLVTPAASSTLPLDAVKAPVPLPASVAPETTPPPVVSSPVVSPPVRSPEASSPKMEAIDDDVPISFPSDMKESSTTAKTPSRTPARRPSSKDDEMADILQSLDEGK